MCELTLNYSSLQEHSANLDIVYHSFQNLSNPTPSTYTPPNSLCTFLSTLIHLLQSSNATLYILSISAVDSASAARAQHEDPSSLHDILSRRAKHMSWRLKELASHFQTLSLVANTLSMHFDKTESEHKRLRVPLANVVSHTEQSLAQLRRAFFQCEARVRELDALVSQARKDERQAALKVALVRCLRIVMLPVRWVGMRKSFSLGNIREAIRRKKRAERVVHRCVSDRVEMIRRKNEEAGILVEGENRVRKAHTVFYLQGACAARAMEDCASVLAIEKVLRKVANVLEQVADCCAAIGDADITSTGKHNQSVAELWQTVSVALRLFHTEQADLTNCLAAQFEKTWQKLET